MTGIFKTLGFKRIVLLLALAVADVAMGAAVYLYYMPHSMQIEREFRTVRQQAIVKREDAERLKMEYEQIQAQKDHFQALEATGFFSDQSRVVARERIEAAQRYTNVLTARYNMQAAKLEKKKEAENSGRVVVNTPVSIDIEALDDMDFYNFIFWIENAFPGHVSVQNVKIERAADVNEATLRQIGSGTAATLVKGTVDFSWRTMMPESLVGQPGGGQMQ
ncbi:MAG: hypothetical protein HY370_03200 [Proteobacteria bacterium]|nr:hypothetical protein [Pseudomonadota bacterium]